MATDMTASGSPEEKLRWAFKMYDKDGSGADQTCNRCMCKYVGQNQIDADFSCRHFCFKPLYLTDSFGCWTKLLLPQNR